MGKTREFGMMHVARTLPLTARILLHGKPSKGRKDRNRQRAPARNSNSCKSARRERDPRILIASPELDLTMKQVVAIYTRRMQIELSFRDLQFRALPLNSSDHELPSALSKRCFSKQPGSFDGKAFAAGPGVAICHR